MKLDYLTKSPAQTRKMGKILAKETIKLENPKKALIVGLVGDLGGGKTTFLQGFAKGLGIKERILSPTFIIIRKSKIQGLKSKIRFFYHIDCYRIQKPQELLDLGFKEIISNPKNIVVVEWADKIMDILPQNAIMLKFNYIDSNKRRIKCSLKK